VIIKLQHCAVRSWRRADAASLVRHADNPKVWRNLRDRFPHPYTRRDADDWIRNASGSKPETNFAIDVAGEAVGGIGMQVQQDVYRRSAEVGYWVAEEHWGRGIATEALGALVEYAFERFDLCRLFATSFDWNPASARVLEKCGFVLEARRRQAVTKEGRTIDDLLYALVRN